MPRISKPDVNHALQVAARTIVKAGGSDGRTSRADLDKTLPTLSAKERALVDVFFKFVDHRDFKSGAQVTKQDVERAVNYAKEKMIAKYDLNNNGLSTDEIAKMSLTGKRAVDLAKALRASAAETRTLKMGAERLGDEIAKYSADAVYSSEGDYNPVSFAEPFPANKALTAENVLAAMESTLREFYGEGGNQDVPPFAVEAYTAAESTEFVQSLSQEGIDEKSDQAFAQITKLLGDNLSDLRVFKVGPRDVRSGALAVDQGLYVQLVVGRSPDGKIAGIMLGDVET